MEAETRIYKVKPFGLDSSVNMRELNPNGMYKCDVHSNLIDMLLDMDKMISIKGLVIRTTPVIPDMKTGNAIDPFIFNHRLTFIQRFSDVKFVTMQSMYRWIEERLQSQPDVLDKPANHRIPCRLSTIAANLRTNKS